ncbi:hypothetical protein [Sphingomonas sp. CV7422]|uniref:hypothetical protein n=1 Tax=Sphingomonas sp. CV7422 TaxID=3018036 RepID=UPI0022FE78F4|nr:hypothetical protein [Sphingomonas sp. CV7422]
MAAIAAPPAAPAEDIVVLGRSIDAAKTSLAACIARQCPPDEEIKASLLVASRQFLAGDYVGARSGLLATRRRNARFDSRYPHDVADLHRALNLMSTLDGRGESARLSGLDATDALRSGLAADDPAILLQRLDSGSQLAHDGRIVGARQIFNDVAARAHRAGQIDVEAQALFRGAATYAALAEVDPSYRATAQSWVSRIESRREPGFDRYRDGLLLLKARLAAGRQHGKAAARALRDAPAVAEAVLLYEPDFTYQAPALATNLGGTSNASPEWADVAFWVAHDGSVADLRLVGQSQSPPGSWLARKMKAVEQRRYAPVTPGGDARGLYQVERYSIVYPLAPTSESRIPTRSPQGRIETTDLTAISTPPAP